MRKREVIDVAVSETAEHAEGPLWDSDAERLLWVDIMGGLVHAHTPTTGARQSWRLGRDVGCVAPLRGGGLIAAVREGFAVIDENPACGSRTIAAPLIADESVRMNDGACDPVGRFWAGSMAYDESAGAGALYRLDLDGTLTQVLSGVTISNGLGWSPSGRHCYYIDSGTRGVDRFSYDIDDGVLSDRERLVSIPAESGVPDGLAVDADGCVWVALWGGGQVQHFDPSGRLLHILQLPVEQVTSCAFGGSDLGDLYITTSRYGLTENQLAAQPLAGSIFVIDPDVTGLPVPPCAYASGPGASQR
ncbi:MAG: SMP-30/gluconolactonase/LRE family protein [Haloechinothrix sp.]